MKKINGESGQTLILVAFGMTVLLGFAGLATDAGLLLHEKRQVQAAADSAALGAASALNAGSTADAAITAGQGDAGNYGISAANVTINIPPSDDVNPNFNATGYVEAIVTQSTPTFFMQLFRKNSVVVSARAVATDLLPFTGCARVNDLPAGASPAADLGGNSLILATKCGIDIEGPLKMSGSSDINAASLAVTGGISYVGSGSSVPTDSSGSAPATSDPLAILSQPADLTTQDSKDPTHCDPPSGSGFTEANCFVNATLGAGMQSGVYMFTQQPTISGNTISATGPVVLYLSGSIPFQFSSNLSMSLAAPTSGTYQGILIDAPNDIATNTACSTGKGNNNAVNGEIYFDFGSSGISLNGTIYAPEAHLFLQDQGAAVTINSDLDVGTLCQQSANLSIGAQSTSPVGAHEIGLVE